MGIRFINKLFHNARVHIKHGKKGIEQIGHRAYVGGMWDEIGFLQFNFLLQKGLEKSHTLLDLGCGSLRAGVHFIKFLDPGNYIGIDKEDLLIDLGIKDELDELIIIEKKPQFIISDKFDFKTLNKKIDFAIAHSLFTHLPPIIIHKCLINLHPYMKKESKFYATFFLSEKINKNPKLPHDHKNFKYTLDQILQFGKSNQYSSNYIGHWDHPRDQVMVEFITI